MLFTRVMIVETLVLSLMGAGSLIFIKIACMLASITSQQLKMFLFPIRGQLQQRCELRLIKPHYELVSIMDGNIAYCIAGTRIQFLQLID